MRDVCLNLLCPPNVEEALLDLLLQTDEIEIFTSFSTNSYGGDAQRLSAPEQVLGRSRSVQLQILLSTTVLTVLIERIQASFSGAGIRYWTTPIASEGEIK